MKKLYYFLMFCCCDILNQNVFAAEKAPDPDFSTMLIRMFSVLAIILALVLLVFFFLKKINFPNKSFLSTKRRMETIETLYLGPKRSVALLRVGGDFVLVGVSPTQINFLSKINLSMDDSGKSNENDQSE